MTAVTAPKNFAQTYTMYARIHLYCLIAAAIFLILAIVLFFVLRIAQVFGELTGRTARQAIQEMEKSSLHSSERASAKKKTVYKEQNTPRQKRMHETHEETETVTLTREEKEMKAGRSSMGDFIILRSIVEIHTDEVI